MSEFRGPLENSVAAIFGKIAEISPSTLSDDGLALFGLLALVSFSYMTIRMVLESGNMTDIMGKLIQSTLMIGIVFWLLQPGTYATIFGSGSISDTGSAVTGTLNVIAGKFLPGGENIANSITATVTLLIEKSVAIMDAMHENVIKSSTAMGKLGDVLGNLFAIIYLVIAAVLLLFAGLIYFAVAVYAQVMVVIALALGPVLIPWIILPITSFLFDGWLRFLIIAGLTKVVGAIMIGITGKVLDAVVSQVNTSDFGNTIMSAMLAALFSLLIVYLMSQIPSIASSLIQGGSGANLMRGISSAAGAAGRGGQAIGAGSTTAGKALANNGGMVGKGVGGAMMGAGKATTVTSGGAVAKFNPSKSGGAQTPTKPKSEG